MALAWRLKILCLPSCRINHEPVLTAWYQERKQQLDKSLASTVRNGSMVNTRSVIQGFLRNWALWCIQLVPSWKHHLEQGPRADGPIQYTHLPGMPFLPEMNGGLCFPQTCCTRMSGAGSVQFTDDVIFAEGKKGIFQIVVLLNRLQGLKSATMELKAMVSFCLTTQPFLSLACQSMHLQMIMNRALSVLDYIARPAQKNSRNPTSVNSVLDHTGIMRHLCGRLWLASYIFC